MKKQSNNHSQKINIISKSLYYLLSLTIFIVLCQNTRADSLKDMTLSNELLVAYSKTDENGAPIPDLKFIEESLVKLSDKKLKQTWLNNLLLGYYSKVDEKGEPSPDLKNVKRLYILIEDEELKKLWANNIKLAEITSKLN